ncbi:MAG: tetratricopeptide repeat protein, partial [Anaerolineae bacterium]|nr:tetratricopeptide repeat protein [Anaerolineae bacterium]
RIAKGDHQGAMEDLNEAIRLNPKDVKAYANRATSYTVMDMKEEAAADWEQYLKLGGGKMFRDQAAVEAKIKDLRKKKRFGLF